MFTAENAMRQAWMTADEYLRFAIKCIDERLGDGYAKKNPDLVGKFMHVAAMDFAAATEVHKNSWGDGDASFAVESAINNVAASLEKIANAVGEAA
jgi:hypothetical protein